MLREEFLGWLKQSGIECEEIKVYLVVSCVFQTTKDKLLRKLKQSNILSSFVCKTSVKSW